MIFRYQQVEILKNSEIPGKSTKLLKSCPKFSKPKRRKRKRKPLNSGLKAEVQPVKVLLALPAEAEVHPRNPKRSQGTTKGL